MRLGTARECSVWFVVAIASATGAVRAGDPDPPPNTIQPFVIRCDPWPDAVARPMALDNVIDLVPLMQTLPELQTIKIGLWQPTMPDVDRFAGQWSLMGHFVRLDLAFDGWLNPPGPIWVENDGFSNPTMYGPNPLLGFVELDVDHNFNTGGHLTALPSRYLGAVGRFGGRLSGPGPYGERMAIGGADLDANFGSQPHVERSGEEFHLALLGEELSELIIRVGNDDPIFDRGETWELRGTFLHRAHGYEPCGFGSPQGIGVYEPFVALLFQHLTTSDTTIVSLVYKLNNTAGASLNGPVIGSPPNNSSALDQSSVLEAITNLSEVAGTALPGCMNLPQWALLAGWVNQTMPAEYLDPRIWHVNALFGTVASAPAAPMDSLVMTDVWPNAVAADFNGDGLRNAQDAQEELMPWIQANDETDGTNNNVVILGDFPDNFSMFDTDYDGLVQISDYWPPRVGDGNDDSDVDLDDWSLLATCMSGPLPVIMIGSTGCASFDFTHDLDVDLKDAAVFQRVFPVGANE